MENEVTKAARLGELYKDWIGYNPHIESGESADDMETVLREYAAIPETGVDVARVDAIALGLTGPRGPVPATLNGFPVLHVAPRSNCHTSRLESFFVIVDRGPGAFQRFVQATWNQTCGDSWLYGNYVNRLSDAFDAIEERGAA